MRIVLRLYSRLVCTSLKYLFHCEALSQLMTGNSVYLTYRVLRDIAISAYVVFFVVTVAWCFHLYREEGSRK